MSNQSKNILRYVGDDGEFYNPIDDYLGNSYVDEWDYPLADEDTPFNSFDRLQLIQALPSRDVEYLGLDWFTDLIYDLDGPRRVAAFLFLIWTTLFIAWLILLIFTLI